MKKVICLLLLCLLPFILLAHENNEQELFMVKESKLTNIEVLNLMKGHSMKKEAFYSKRFYILNEKYEYWIVLCKMSEERFVDVYVVGFNNKEIMCLINLLYIEQQIDPEKLFLFENSIIQKQISKFQLCETSGFVYDFNHDGTDDELSFKEGGQGITYALGTIRNDERRFIWGETLPLSISYSPIEFINYKVRQGIKFYNKDEWQFYYYDRVQQKYVRDETASSEELEQIHGSPDFFAEAGIDYTKLERLLIPADLEGFSKPALRIWRNAVYARHGRIFKSEDLQALFNEYTWYKADKNYTDAKLTDTDKANIKLISEFEKK